MFEGVALAPLLLSWLAKKHFKGKNYSKTGLLGVITTVVAILTGVCGLISVTQDCFEALMVSFYT